MQTNHFELLRLPTRFDIDRDLLEKNFRLMQAEVHPDRFVSATPAEKLRSMQLATQVNEAYQILKHPTARGRYLLHLQGIDTEEESNTAMPADFLMLQMEWREAAEEASASHNIAELEQLLTAIRNTAHSLQHDLAIALQAKADTAATIVRKLSFIDKVEEDIVRKIEKLED